MPGRSSPVVTVERLDGAALPAQWGLARDPVIPPAGRGPDHDARYDATTLVYGACWRADKQALVLVSPPWRNLAAVLGEGRFVSELGEHRLIRHRRRRRIDEIWLAAAAPPSRLQFVCLDAAIDIPLIAPLPGFGGTRSVMTISQDNDLGWIADWTRHLVRHQGVTSLLFIDNRSQGYAPQDIADCLTSIDGLARAHVIDCPLPYGPTATRPPRNAALFLQTGLLQLCRHGWLREAGTVLHCDIDELLVSDGETLFEAAERGRLGYATALCHWRYRAPGPGLPRFGEHVLRRQPETFSKEKWVVRPAGPLGDTLWQSHGVAHYLLNRPTRQRGSRFYHCESIATNWKRPREGAPGDTVVDPRTVADLQRLGFEPSEIASEARMQPVKR